MKSSDKEMSGYNTYLEALPEETKQWLTGFFEGDGSLYRSQNIGLSFGQRDRQILDYIKELLMLEGSPSFGNTGRNGFWILRIERKAKVLPLLLLLSNRFVCPTRIAQFRNIFDIDVVEQNPTFPWLVGFWDAEGHSKLSYMSKVELYIAQGDRKPLEKLQCLVGAGSLGKNGDKYWDLEWVGFATKKVVPYILQFSKNQDKTAKLVGNLLVAAQFSRPWAAFLNGIRKERWWLKWIREE